jgi:hypothetical protein
MSDASDAQITTAIPRKPSPQMTVVLHVIPGGVE